MLGSVILALVLRALAVHSEDMHNLVVYSLEAEKAVRDFCFL